MVGCVGGRVAQLFYLRAILNYRTSNAVKMHVALCANKYLSILGMFLVL